MPDILPTPDRYRNLAAVDYFGVIFDRPCRAQRFAGPISMVSAQSKINRRPVGVGSDTTARVVRV